MNRTKLIIQTFISIPFGIGIFGVILFLPAGSLKWMPGWIYLAGILLLLLSYYGYFLVKSPITLEKREKLSSSIADNVILGLMTLFFFTIIILSGFCFRWNIFQVSIIIVIIGNILIILGYLIVILGNKENSFASLGVTVQDEQKIITTGPYRYVRHPMYAGFALMFLCLPFALGNWITLIASIIFIIILLLRIRLEEKMLIEHFADYRIYKNKVKYRLIPKIW